jgi:alpha-beta hydrolase superfamily lysophospholipase
MQGSQFTGFDSSFYFASQGDSLFYRKWGELKTNERRKVLLVIHGIGYHCLPFRKIMNYTGNCNVLVYAMDLRRHGFSGGTKGILESNEKVLTDMDNMISIIKNENPNTQIYLLGTSMGGLYILGYALSCLHSDQNWINSRKTTALLYEIRNHLTPYLKLPTFMT